MNYTRNQDGSIASIVDGKSVVISKEHPNYKLVVQAIKDNDEASFKKYANIVEGLKAFANTAVTGVEVVDGQVRYKGRIVDNACSKYILELYHDGFPVDSACRFMENLYQNPSARAIAEAPDFLRHEYLALTEDGCFLAYKTVCHNYYSKTSGSLTLLNGKANSNGQIYNGIGEVIECPRNEVDDEKDRTCSHGLHVGALKYAGPDGWFHDSGDVTVIVKVNPKDIVSVPADHDGQKLRVCRYEVVGEYKGTLNKAVYSQDEEYAHDDEYDEEAYTEDLRQLEVEEVSEHDLAYGDEISFDYHNVSRRGTVESVGPTSVTVLMLSPDKGDYRTFNYDKMSNCVVYLD